MGVLEAILANPVDRAILVSVIAKVASEIFRRNAADPAYLSKLDAAMDQNDNAKTDEEKTHASAALSALLGSGV